MKTINNILFDFDGTLVDSAPGIVITMTETFKKMGIPVPTEAEMRATIGLKLNKSLQILGKLSEEESDKASEIYRELFPVYEANYIKVFPEVKETLKQLKERGIRMAIVTSRDTQSLDMIANRHQLYPLFETWVTGADGFAPKPAPDMVLALLERMKIQTDDTLVVGDTTFDIEMGNAAGCRTCAVTYGNHDAQKLQTANPSFMINDFTQLLTLNDSIK